MEIRPILTSRTEWQCKVNTCNLQSLLHNAQQVVSEHDALEEERPLSLLMDVNPASDETEHC